MKKFIWILIVIVVSCGLVWYKSLFFANEWNLSPKLQKFVSHSYDYNYFAQKESSIARFVSDEAKWYMQKCHKEKKLCQFMLHQSLLADWLLIKWVQFAGNGNQRWFEEDLYVYLDMLSDLQPYWEYPYVLGESLLPRQRADAVFVWSWDLDISWENAIAYGEKWVGFLCDDGWLDWWNMSEKEFMKLWIEKWDKWLSWGCQSASLPHNLAFVYYHYLWDAINAVRYYRLEALSTGFSNASLMMSAIVMWNVWEHQKSAMMWFEKFEMEMSLWNEEKLVQKYLNKALFEMSLSWIEDAVELAWERCEHDLECLREDGWLSKAIISQDDKCKDLGNKSMLDTSQCAIWSYGLDNGYVSLGWDLIYAVESGFVYAWRPDVKSWWILRKNN